MRKLTNLSIASRLAWLCSISTFVVLLLLSYFLYGSFVHIIDEANQQTLRDELHYIKNIVKHSDRPLKTLKKQFSWIPETVKNSNWISPYDYIRILGHNDNTLFETPGLSKIISGAKFSSLIKANDPDAPILLWKSPQRHYYLLISGRATSKGSNQPNKTSQIALDVTQLQHAIASYRKLLFAAMIIATIFTALLGWLIAKRGMVGITKLTKAAERITVHHKSVELDPSNWPGELRSLTKTLNKALAQTQENYQRLSQFSANLAHELRTPMNNLISATEVILSNKRNVDEYQKLLSSNLEEFQWIANLLDRLLFLARVDDPSRALNLTTIQLDDEFSLSCDYFQVLAEEKDIHLSYTGHAALKADLTLFRQALNNIIANAIDYTKPDGKITLVATSTDQAVLIKVSDTGIGIPEAAISQLGNRFYQAQPTAEQKPGVGWGLAIVHSIMKLHHGSLSIESKTNQGTNVTLSFPKDD